jgi:D-beta-D-heptose 7-phosphate kinase/D-beta-D-heptose 1-phosphate adenosyltransferase
MEFLRDYIHRQAQRAKAIIVSDYGKGVVGEALLKQIVEMKEKNGILVTVDPKVNHFPLYRGVTAVTPNHLEASRAVGMDISSEEDLVEIGRRLLRELHCEMLLITRGEEGMTLFQNQEEHLHIPTVAREVFDVTGAGDTVISAFTLALSVGASPMEAALLANLSAGIVVGEVGTATVSNKRLQRVLRGVEQLP